MRILIADDHDSSRRLLRLTLAAEGHDVIEATDGREALDKLESASVDAIISDILMPRMDGYRFCYETRQVPAFQDLPIIIYSSTYTSPAEESVALNMGADRFLRKPASAGALLQALSDVMQKPRNVPRRLARTDELGILKEFNERLVQKLEEKNAELEQTQEKLTAAYDKLERSEKRFRELVELAPIGIYQIAPDGLLIAANTAFARMLGYTSPQELVGLELAHDLLVDASDRIRCLPEFSRSGKVSAVELNLKRRDGTAIRVEADGRAVRDPVGRILRYEVFNRDVTDQRSAEEALRQSEQRFRQVTESIGEVFWLVDLSEHRVIYVSPAYENIWGRPCESLYGSREAWVDSIHPDDRARVRDAARTLPESGNYDLEYRIVRPNGTFRWIHDRARPIRDAAQNVYRIAGVAEDVTERRRTEAEIRRSEERFRRLFESNTIGIAVADLSGVMTEANDAHLDMLGYSREELLAGKLNWGALTPPEYRELDRLATEQLRRTGVAPPWEKEMVRKDGTRVPVLLGLAMLEASEANSCIAYILDLSNSRQLERQARQAQKMEAIGQLAGGVAHDFNNLLTAILGYADLLKHRWVGDGAGLDELEEIRKAGERAAALTRQLLAFSRRQVLEPRVLELNEIVGDLEKMLRRLIGEDIALATTLEPALGRVRADAGEIEQIIVNLVVNSRDAMPRGGKITVETANVELDETAAQRQGTLPPGRYVVLTVSDTGSGMDPETQARVFEPFFTTKPKDKGTGLGLSMVYGIVKRSGGSIGVSSQPGRGATFTVYLPEVDEVAEAIPSRVEAAPVGGSETVLLVEDEPSVRKLARIFLENLGYTVLEAADTQDALFIARARALPIHLVLTDVVMPEMGGADLAAKIQEARPEARALYMSGYADDAIIRDRVLEREMHFLQKPFTPVSLARKVREALA